MSPFLLVVVMKHSTLPFPFAKAMDVTNQVLFLITLASFSNSQPENADLQKIASQLKVTHYDCGELTENNLYALNQVPKMQHCPQEPRSKQSTNHAVHTPYGYNFFVQFYP